MRSGLVCLPFSHIYFCFRFTFRLYLFAIINLITFVAFAMDKWKLSNTEEEFLNFLY